MKALKIKEKSLLKKKNYDKIHLVIQMNFNDIHPLYLKELKASREVDDYPKYASMQIITHDDMDGYASAAVVYHAFLNAGIISKNSCSINHYNYSDKIQRLTKMQKLYLLLIIVLVMKLSRMIF